MRVSSDRRFVEDAESNPHNPTPHHVVLATRGRNVVSYTSLAKRNRVRCRRYASDTPEIGQKLTPS